MEARRLLFDCSLGPTLSRPSKLRLSPGFPELDPFPSFLKKKKKPNPSCYVICPQALLLMQSVVLTQVTSRCGLQADLHRDSRHWHHATRAFLNLNISYCCCNA